MCFNKTIPKYPDNLVYVHFPKEINQISDKYFPE